MVPGKRIKFLHRIRSAASMPWAHFGIMACWASPMRDDNFLRLLRPFFDDTTLERGLDYARRGLVRVTATRTRDDSTQIKATCEGSSSDPYEQRMEVIIVSGRVANVVNSQCTCPMTSDCKHVVAAITTWLDSQQERSTLMDSMPTEPIETATMPSIQR